MAVLVPSPPSPPKSMLLERGTEISENTKNKIVSPTLISGDGGRGARKQTQHHLKLSIDHRGCFFQQQKNDVYTLSHVCAQAQRVDTLTILSCSAKRQSRFATIPQLEVRYIEVTSRSRRGHIEVTSRSHRGHANNSKSACSE
jgi:hypothetical protein